MQVFNFEQWASTSGVSTDPGNFVGIAIGDDSDEGTVRVNGSLLQAGRPRPLSSNGGAYVIARERIPQSIASLAAIAKLQLYMFECQAELAAALVRADKTYSASKAITVAGGATRLVTAAFRGRRQALVELASNQANVTYTVYGLRYLASKSAVLEHPLVTETLASMSANGTYAFYVGGTNEGEHWDALALDVTTPADATWYADIVAIGEGGL